MSINASGLTLAQLRAFVALAQFLHFRAAAAAIGISQPTLSATIASCEESLGTRLVERTTRRVMLTTAGQQLLPLARNVLDAVDELRAQADAVGKAFTGKLRLGIIPTVAPYLVPTLLRGLRRRYPDLVPVLCEAYTAHLADGLLAGRYDVAVLAVPIDLPGIVAEPLYTEDFVLAVPKRHPLAGAEAVAPSALRELDVLLLDEDHCMHDQVIDVCRDVGAGELVGTRTASMATLVQLVAAEMGVTLLPETAIDVETRRAPLRTVRFQAPAPHRQIGLVYRASAGRSAEYAEIAGELRRLLRTGRLPVKLAG